MLNVIEESTAAQATHLMVRRKHREEPGNKIKKMAQDMDFLQMSPAFYNPHPRPIVHSAMKLVVD